MFSCDNHWKFWTFSILNNLETNFIKNTNLFQKTEQNESWTNRMGSTKRTYHKKRFLASNYFFFRKFCFRLRTSHKELIWCFSHPNVHIQTFQKHWSFFEGAFSPWVSIKVIAKCKSLLIIFLGGSACSQYK